MDKQVMKGVRLPIPMIRRIERIAKAECTTFSQFMRSAALEKLRRTTTAA